MFGTDKPVIGLVHLHALPTDPKYDPQSGVEGVLEAARFDLLALQEGGIDGVLFCNEFSIPYTHNVKTVTVACMARVIGELKSLIKVPFGVCVASDPRKGFDLAAAVGADLSEKCFMVHLPVFMAFMMFHRVMWKDIVMRWAAARSKQ